MIDVVMRELARVDESDFSGLNESISAFYKIQFINQNSIKFDTEELKHQLMLIPTKRDIRSVTLDYTSLIDDLSVLKAFENIDYLNIQSKQIKSLSGLDSFKKLSSLMLDVKVKDISNLFGLECIQSLGVEDFKKENLEVFGSLSSLKYLTLSKGVVFDVKDISNCTVGHLNLRYCKSESLSDFSSLKNIEKLHLFQCRKLKFIDGDNSKVKHLKVTACNNLDLSFLSSFSGLVNLELFSIKKITGFNEIKSLSNLSALYVTHSKFEIIDYSVFSGLYNLKKIWIEGQKPETLKNASCNLKGKVLTNSIDYFFEGKAVDFKFYETFK